MPMEALRTWVRRVFRRNLPHMSLPQDMRLPLRVWAGLELTLPHVHLRRDGTLYDWDGNVLVNAED